MIPRSSLGGEHMTLDVWMESCSNVTYGRLASACVLFAYITHFIGHFGHRSPPWLQEVYFSFFVKCTWVTFSQLLYLISRFCNQARNHLQSDREGAFTPTDFSPFKKSPGSFSCTPWCGLFQPVWKHPSHMGAYQNTRTETTRNSWPETSAAVLSVGRLTKNNSTK